MITSVKRIIKATSQRIREKFGIRAVIKNTAHFQERVLQRFEEDELPALERAVVKAFEKAAPNGKTFKYTHPAYNVTVVIKKLGMNGLELVTCWKKNEEEVQYA